MGKSGTLRIGHAKVRELRVLMKSQGRLRKGQQNLFIVNIALVNLQYLNLLLVSLVFVGT